MEAEATRLRTFWERVRDRMWDGWEVDGGDIQTWGVELGLLKAVKFDPAIHAEDIEAEPGDAIYVDARDGVGEEA